MMPEWHQLDSSTTMSEQQESAKKKTLKSSSRLFWFSTGLILFQGSGGGPTFPRGGVQLFPGGGGVQMLISIETHITCDFPGGWSGPTLWIRTLDRQVVKGAGSERDVGYFLKGRHYSSNQLFENPLTSLPPPPPPMLLDLYQSCYFSPIKHILWEIVGRFYMRILCMSLQNNRLEV